MTEQTSPAPSKAHAPSPLDIPARTAAPKPAAPRPGPPAAAQPPGSAQPTGAQPTGAQPAGAQPAGAQPAGAQATDAPPATTATRSQHPSPTAAAEAPVRVTGAQALVMALERVGVDVVFGIPGGAVLPAYDPLLDSEQIRHILVRHEQGA